MRPLTAIDTDLQAHRLEAHALPDDHPDQARIAERIDQLLEERQAARGPVRPSQVLAR